jgi:arylsulfatase A-like enzyme
MAPNPWTPARPRLSAPLLALCLCALGTACGTEASEARSVVLITCDTLRADRLGVYGYDRPTSPRLDAFAREGIVFDTAYASAPWTRPALSSLMTGRYAEEVGAAPGNLRRMPAEVETLAERIAAHGLATAAVVSNGLIRRPPARAGDVDLAQGFGVYDDTMTSMEPNRPMPERLAPQTTDAALAWLERHEAAGGGRFFLWVHYQDPHGPYTPPRSLAGAFDRPTPPDEPLLPIGTTMRGAGQIPRYQVLPDPQGRPEQRPGVYRDRYDAEIAFFDAQLGRLLDALAARPGWPDTLVVFSADHGESLGEGDSWFCHGEHVQVEAVRVPLIVRLPRGERGPPVESAGGLRRTSALVGHVDLWPTVLEALGLPSAGSRGVSLLRGEPPAGRVLGQSFLPPQEARRQWAVTDGRWRLVLGAGSVAPRLYDHSVDPREERDVAPQHPEIVADLRARQEAALRSARVPAHQGSDVELDPETLRALQRLGYAEVDEEGDGG